VYLDFTSPFHVGEMQNDDMTRRADYKQSLIKTVENDALNAELRIVTQWVIAADLQRTTT